jgi:hypothetical protein
VLRDLELPLAELTEALLARNGSFRQMAAILALKLNSRTDVPSVDSIRLAQPRGLSSYALRG